MCSVGKYGWLIEERVMKYIYFKMNKSIFGSPEWDPNKCWPL
jgi:hypothetical protein